MRRCDNGGDVTEVHDGGLERRLLRLLLCAQDQTVLAYRSETAYLAIEREVKLNVNSFTESDTNVFGIKCFDIRVGGVFALGTTLFGFRFGIVFAPLRSAWRDVNARVASIGLVGLRRLGRQHPTAVCAHRERWGE